MSSLVEIGSVVLEKTLFKFRQRFSLFHNYFSLEKERALHMNKMESLHPRMHCGKFGWKWPSGSGEDFFANLSLSPLGKGQDPAFIWTNLNLLHPNMHCVRFGWYWLSGSGEYFNISSMYFYYFVIISTTTTTTDKFWSEKLTRAFGSGELKIQK